MKTVFPDYNNSIVNVTNSILNYFDIPPRHSTLSLLDGILAKKAYKNIVLILNDGLGMNVLRKNLPSDDFLFRYLRGEITSVFPSTTTAALTSGMTGLTPVEHCWLGWDVYVKELDKIVTLLENTLKDTDIQAADYLVGAAFFPYEDAFALINKHGKYHAHSVSPFHEYKYDFAQPEDMYRRIEALCAMPGRRYIGAYNNEPDGIMHRYGTEHDNTKQRVHYISSATQALCKRLTDTLVVLVADHGHIDCKWVFLEDHPDIKNLLTMDISIEPRAVNFFVREGCEEEFEGLFNSRFSRDFLLMKRQEFQKLFGDGTPHERFDSCLGQFMAISISDVSMLSMREDRLQSSTHAGLTEQEMMIPLIAVDCDEVV